MSFNDNKDPLRFIKSYKPQKESVWANFNPLGFSEGINMILDKARKQVKERDTAHDEQFIGEVCDPILGRGDMYVSHSGGAEDWEAHIRTEWSFEYYTPLPPHNWGTKER